MPLELSFLMIACACSVPSASLMFGRSATSVLSTEMVMGTAIATTALGLSLTDGSTFAPWIAAMVGALVARKAQHSALRLPLLVLAGCAFLAYLYRMSPGIV